MTWNKHMCMQIETSPSDSSNMPAETLSHKQPDFSLPVDLSTLQAFQSAIHTSLDAIRRNEAYYGDDKTIYTGIAGGL